MPASLSKQAPGATRTFIAIELPEPILTILTALEPDLLEYERSLRIVAPELLHLTVRFLGMLSSERVEAAVDAARAAAAVSVPFELTLGSVGAFYATGKRPRVVWVGLRPDSGYQALQGLFLRLEDELERREFAREPRRFSPHLTIARVGDGLTESEGSRLGATIAAMSARGGLAGTFEVRDTTVMRSDLSPRGPKYTPICRVPLSGTAEDRIGSA